MGLWKLVCVAILPLAAIAQEPVPGVKFDLTGLTYPPLSRLARIQGSVTVELIPNENGTEIKLINGHPLLVAQATANVAKWRVNQPVTVSYIFKLMAVGTVKVRVPKGDAFDRFFLRIFHLPTYTDQEQCDSSFKPPTASEPRVVRQSPLTMEVEITATKVCIQTATSFVASH